MFIHTLWSIGATLAFSVLLIKRNHYVRPLSIFVVLYVIGQMIGYGFGVDILKAVVPSFAHPENGVAYQVITSTVFPLVSAFVLDYVYRIVKTMDK